MLSQRSLLRVVAFVVPLSSGCERATAMDACQKLERAGVAARCAEDRTGSAFTASDATRFELPNAPRGGTPYGEAFRYPTNEAFYGAEHAAQALCLRPQCAWYASGRARMLVRTWPALEAADEKKLRAVVDGL